MRQRLLRGLSANAFGQIVTITIQLLSVPLFIAFWGVQQFGEWLVLSAIPMYLSLSDVGFASVAANEMTMRNARGDKPGVLEIYQAGTIMVGACCFLIFGLIILIITNVNLSEIIKVKTISESDIKWVIGLLSAQTLLTLYCGMQYAGFRATGSYATGTVVLNIVRLSEWLAGAIVVATGGGAVQVACAFLIVRISGIAITQFFLARTAPWLRVSLKNANLNKITHLIKPAVSFMAFPLGYSLSLQGATIAIGQSMGGGEVVIFTVYRTLTRFIIQVSNILTLAVGPELSVLFGQNNYRQTAELYRKTLIANTILGIVCSAVLLTLGNFVVMFWTHGQVSANTPILLLLTFAAFVAVIWQASWTVLLSTNNHHRLSYVFLFSNLAAVIAIGVIANDAATAAIILIFAEMSIAFSAIFQCARLLKNSSKSMANSPLNIIVCGKFHYDKYVQFLQDIFCKIYFSHKPNTFVEVPRIKKSNQPIKEYILGLHLAIFKDKLLWRMMPLYHLIWQIETYLFFQPRAVNIFLLHGASTYLMQKAKKAGKLIVGEAVNIHPRVLERILTEEAGSIGSNFQANTINTYKIEIEIALCDYILAPSTAVKESYIECGFAPEKIHVIPYGFPSCHLKDRGKIDAAKTKIVTIGQVTLRKGQYRLVKALHQQMDKYSITLIGRDNPDYLAKLRGINKSFTHIQHVPHDMLMKELPGYDIFVLPSIEDGFAVAVAEALSAGLPVLVSKYAGASEVIQNIGGGLVFDPKDDNDIVIKLERIVAGDYPKLTILPPSWADYANKVEKQAAIWASETDAEITNY
ncbi:MAG: glycosyltransferase [Nitrososphaerales archaeon]